MDIDNLEELGRLARVAMSVEEKESLRADLEKILAYVSELKNVPAGAGAVGGAAGAGDGLVNVWREDSVPRSAGEQTEELLFAAPRRRGGYIAVKKIL